MDSPQGYLMNNSNFLQKRLVLVEEIIHEKAKKSDEIRVSALLEALKQLDHEAEPFADSIPFVALTRDFSLTPFESNVLFLALAPSIDFNFRQKVAELRRNFACTQIDVALALDLFSVGIEQRIRNRGAFAPTGALFSHHLCELEPKLGASSQIQDMGLNLPPRIVAHLLEQEDSTTFDGFSRILRPETRMDQVILPEKKKNQILALVRHYEQCLAAKKQWGFEEIGDGGRNVILLFSGPSGTGKTLMAQAIAHELHKPLLLVDAHELQANRGLEDNLDKLMREARLQRAILLFDDCELIFASRTQGNRDLPLLLAALDAYEGLVIMTTNLPTVLDSALDRRVTLQVDFDILPAKLRETIWKLHIPKEVELDADVDLPHLAEKYEFSGGTIRNAVAVAMNRALGCAEEPLKIRLTMPILDESARSQIRNRIKKLADKTLTSLSLEDLVLPRKIKDKIRSLIASVRNRRTIFEEWGFGEKITKGRGICALFRGDSGTGKTLSAEIIAYELGMTLYRVRIPAIISKYVGETEKNLEKCFREAAASGALLLFDEADSIFSKRTEVKDSNDRYSNMEVNLLLQEVERFEGVVILTTNLDAAIDDAFERRLNHKIDFPFPDARDRARIWKRLLPEAAPLGEDIDFEALGRDFELSGGCIKNSVLRAAYKAAERKSLIDMALLEASGLQEYREMGKLVPNRRNPWD